MARLNGTAQKEKQEMRDETANRAKAECEFSDRLYDILMEYQEGFHTRRAPPKKVEKIGGLSLELSGLYNQIWSVVIDLDGKTRSKKKK